MGAPAKSVLDGEFFLLGDFGGFEHGVDSGHVNGDGFFTKNVFAGLDGGADMLWAEAWRCGENDEVDTGIDDLLEGVEASELTFRGNLSAVAVVRGVFESVFARFLKGITDGPEDGVFVSIEGLCERTGAASTSADETDFDGVVVTALCSDNVRESDKGGGSEGTASLDDLASCGVDFGGHDFWVFYFTRFGATFFRSSKKA